MTRARRDLFAAAGLAVVVALLFGVAYHRFDHDAWETPIAYGGDAWQALAHLKAAQDGHVLPLRALNVPELNAPFGASWNDFLRQHKPQLALAGLLARHLGLFPTANLLLLLAHVLAALSFYAARAACAVGARGRWRAPSSSRCRLSSSGAPWAT